MYSDDIPLTSADIHVSRGQRKLIITSHCCVYVVQVIASCNCDKSVKCDSYGTSYHQEYIITSTFMEY